MSKVTNRNTMIKSLNLFALLLTTCHVFGEVPVEVESVKTFGNWRDSSGKHGEFRLIMTNLGWENIRYKIQAEKILFRDDLQSKEIIESVVLADGQEGFNLIKQDFNNNTFTFTYQSLDASKYFKIISKFTEKGVITTNKTDIVNSEADKTTKENK